jgi:preprotein translocase subunit YajC
LVETGHYQLPEKEIDLRKIRFLNLVVILTLLGITTFLAGCSTTTTSSTSSSSSLGTWLILIIFIVVIFGFMYFFTIRPQQKKRQETLKMLQSLQIEDNVITNGGIYGKIQNVYADSFILKTDSGDTIRVAKWAVVGKLPDESSKTS